MGANNAANDRGDTRDVWLSRHVKTAVQFGWEKSGTSISASDDAA